MFKYCEMSVVDMHLHNPNYYEDRTCSLHEIQRYQPMYDYKRN